MSRPCQPPAIVEADYPTARLTTVGTGGPARWFARPTTVAELGDVLAWAAGDGLEIAVIGLGSNLLVADEGYDGVVIRLAGELARIERDGDRITCGGGASLAAIVKRATGLGALGDRVRVRDPRHGRRCGAHERRRIRRRDPRRARRGARDRSGRRAPRRA